MSTITLCYSPDCETISFAAAELERYLKAVNPAFAFSHASESSAANDCTIHLNTDLDRSFHPVWIPEPMTCF